MLYGLYFVYYGSGQGVLFRSTALLPVVRDPSCNRLDDVVTVIRQEVHVIAVDEAGLDEDDRHGRATEGAKAGWLLFNF